MIEVNGSEYIERKDEKALEYAVTDATQDIRVVTILTHPRHTAHILNGGGENASEAIRIWKMDDADNNGWPEILDELRLNIG